jgi:hypothetical protein
VVVIPFMVMVPIGTPETMEELALTDGIVWSLSFNVVVCP